MRRAKRHGEGYGLHSDRLADPRRAAAGSSVVQQGRPHGGRLVGVVVEPGDEGLDDDAERLDDANSAGEGQDCGLQRATLKRSWPAAASYHA